MSSTNKRFSHTKSENTPRSPKESAARGANAPVRTGPWGVGPGFLKLLMQASSQVLTWEFPADYALRMFFKQHSSLGRRDRAMLSETVFDWLRNKRLYDQLSVRLNGPLVMRLVVASLVKRGVPILPETLNPIQHEAVAGMREIFSNASKTSALSNTVTYSLPDWLWEAWMAEFGVEHAKKLGAKMLEAAPLDLRVNTAKTDIDTVREKLLAEGLEVHPIDWMPGALRVAGKPALDKSATFLAGDLEVQDVGSQWLAALVDAKRGQTVIDFCAGAGGKTLALAAAMRGSGQIFAIDVSASRLQRLSPRLVRAGVTNIQPLAIDSETDPKLKRLFQRADRVLVDAPCTGTGTLRRNPDIKWRQTASGADELGQKQLSILTEAAKLVKAKGRLIYATCSVLRRENEDVIAAFLECHPDFELINEEAGKLADVAVKSSVLRLDPVNLDSDGFAAAILRRKPLVSA